MVESAEGQPVGYMVVRAGIGYENDVGRIDQLERAAADRTVETSRIGSNGAPEDA